MPSSPRMRTWAAIVLWVVASARPVAFAATPQAAPPQAPRTGRVHVTIADHIAFDPVEEFARRAGDNRVMLKRGDADYRLADESFEAFVPAAAANAKNPHGLLVWI